MLHYDEPCDLSSLARTFPYRFDEQLPAFSNVIHCGTSIMIVVLVRPGSILFLHFDFGKEVASHDQEDRGNNDEHHEVETETEVGGVDE